eukprot:14639623-Alexandrium_andersonii.AAC.1
MTAWEVQGHVGGVQLQCAKAASTVRLGSGANTSAAEDAEERCGEPEVLDAAPASASRRGRTQRRP